MAARKQPLINGEIYHVVIRAVDSLQLFRNPKDYLRMLFALFVFNDQDSVPINFRKKVTSQHSRSDLEQLIKRIRKHHEQKALVEIFAFCLMPNHVHLLIRQTQEGGISKFMQKLCTSYGMCYNKKYERQGHVFQGRYRIVHIKTQKQLKTVFVYIHTNPISLIVSHWKEKGIQDFAGTVEFLENYEWSSYCDYLKKKTTAFVTERESLTEIMGGAKGCQDFVNAWLKFKQELADFPYVALE